jgi:hypothetical protein
MPRCKKESPGCNRGRERSDLRKQGKNTSRYSRKATRTKQKDAGQNSPECGSDDIAQDAKKFLPDASASIDEAIFQMDSDGHGMFRDLCAIYGDSHRPIFLSQILEYFLRTANQAELKAIRKAVQGRERRFRDRGRSVGLGEQFDAEWLKQANVRLTPVARGDREQSNRGRPRAHSDSDWIAKAGRVAWQRHVFGWAWRKIAEYAGLKPSDENWEAIERTLRRWVDQYAALVWRAIPLRARGPEGLCEGSLDDRQIQYCLKDKAGLPFQSHPEQCKKLVLKLAHRGAKAHARSLVGSHVVAFTL